MARADHRSWRNSLVHPREGGEIEFARVGAFSDGVLAIAITLLVLTLEVPDVAQGELASAMADNWREYLAAVLSFALIGRFWISHHRTFGLMARTDGTIMSLNLLFLGLIVLVPFTTDLFADFSDSPLAVGLYAASIGSAAVVHWLMVRYAVSSGAVRPSRSDHAQAGASWRALTPGATFLASIPVAFVSPTLAVAMWLLTFVPGLRPRHPKATG